MEYKPHTSPGAFLQICFFLSMVFSLECHAQTLPYKQYSLEQGLAHSTVFRIFQDSRGFLWFGTQYGLSRYDGTSFSNYSVSEGLLGNTVMSITEGPDAKLYVGSYRGGIQSLEGNVFREYGMQRRTPNTILYTSIDKLGRFWVVYKDTSGWKAGYIHDERFTPFDLGKFIPGGDSTGINRVVALRDSSVLFCTAKGAYILSHRMNFTLLNHEITGMVYMAEEDRNGNIVLCTQGTIYWLDKRGAIRNKVALPHGKYINTMKVASDGKIWGFLAGFGVFCLDNGRIMNISSLLKLKNTIINDIYEDSEHNIWLASYGMGVYCIRNFYVLNFTAEEGLSNNFVSTITEDDDGDIILGSMGGLSSYRDETMKSLHTEMIPGEIPNAATQFDGKTWLITPERILAINRNGDLSFQGKIAGLSLYNEMDKVLWVGGYLGLFIYKDKSFQRPENYPQGLMRRITGITQDGSKKLWFATDSGVYCYDGIGYRHYSRTDGLPSNDIKSLCSDRKGNIWLATVQGICRFESGKWISYGTSEGLSHNRCSSILADGDGRIWVATLRGINCFDGKVFQKHGSQQGLLSDEVNVLYLDKAKNLWAGTVKGVSRVSLDMCNPLTRTPPVYITRIRIANQDVDLDSTLSLPYDISSLKINFVAVRPGGSHDLVYQYKLNNSDDKWLETYFTSVQFSSLASGAYTFQVRARDIHNRWFSEAAQVSFTIKPPFWETWWFVGSSFLVLAFILYSGLNMRIERVKREQEEKTRTYTRILNLRQQALNALLNPHFIFNSLNSIQYFINRSDKESANEYLADFADLIRKTMEDSERIFVSLKDELSRLFLYLELEQLRFSNKLDYHIQVDPSLDTEAISIPSLLIQPYVENAIWHGIMPKDGKGNVSVKIYPYEDGQIQILIEDDGVGLTASQGKKHKKHASKGMKIMEERLELISKLTNNGIHIQVGEIHSEEGAVQGTRVEIILSVHLPQSVA